MAAHVISSIECNREMNLPTRVKRCEKRSRADGSRPVEWNRSNCDDDRPILVVITAEVVKVVRQWRDCAL